MERAVPRTMVNMLDRSVSKFTPLKSHFLLYSLMYLVAATQLRPTTTTSLAFYFLILVGQALFFCHVN